MREDAAEVEDFYTHKATPIKVKPSLPFENVIQACHNLKNHILTSGMSTNIEYLIKELIFPNSDLQQAIYPIIVRPNQAEHLPYYLELLNSKLMAAMEDSEAKPEKDPAKVRDRRRSRRKEDEGSCSQEEGNRKERPRNCQVHFGVQPQQIFYRQIHGTDVRDIILDIYSDSEDLEGKPDFKLYIYFVKDVTNLSDDNLYTFSKGITNKKFIAFVPTFQSLDSDRFDLCEKARYQKIMTHIYDSKTLFCQYFYQCILDSEIKGYLPAQACRLITDMDYYSLSYTESCRRLDYCILKALQLNSKPRPNLPDFQPVISCINTVFRKIIKIQAKPDCEKIIRIILKEDEKYVISNKMISVALQIAQGGPDAVDMTEAMLISLYRASLTKKLQVLDPTLVKYLSQEESTVDHHKTRQKNRKNERLEIFMGSKPQLSPKICFENQITRIIKDMSRQCRNFAKSLTWADFRFEERIKPCIPFKIVQSMREDEETEDIVNEVTSNYSKPLSSLLGLFPEEHIGEGLYLIKSVELSGLFTLSRRQINPLAYNNFFEKARF